MELRKVFQEKRPVSLKVKMRVRGAVDHRIGPRDNRDFRQSVGVYQSQLSICFTHIDDGDVAGVGAAGHGRWNTVFSSVCFGLLSGFVSMMSAMNAHHFLTTGCSGRLSIV